MTCFCPAQDEVGPQEALRMGGQAGFLPYLPTATLLHAAMGAPPGAEVRCSIQCVDAACSFLYVLSSTRYVQVVAGARQRM